MKTMDDLVRYIHMIQRKERNTRGSSNFPMMKKKCMKDLPDLKDTYRNEGY